MESSSVAVNGTAARIKKEDKTDVATGVPNELTKSLDQTAVVSASVAIAPDRTQEGSPAVGTDAVTSAGDLSPPCDMPGPGRFRKFAKPWKQSKMVGSKA